MQPSAWLKGQTSAPPVRAGKLTGGSFKQKTNGGQMNDLHFRKTIQRWENEGGALLPKDCNVHFWNYRSVESQRDPLGSDGASTSDAISKETGAQMTLEE
jgi:hypothetical protein